MKLEDIEEGKCYETDYGKKFEVLKIIKECTSSPLKGVVHSKDPVDSYAFGYCPDELRKEWVEPKKKVKLYAHVCSGVTSDWATFKHTNMSTIKTIDGYIPLPHLDCEVEVD